MWCIVWFFRNCLCRYYGTTKCMTTVLNSCSKTKWSRFFIFRFLAMLRDRAIFIWMQMLDLLKIKQCSFYLVFLLESTFGLFTALFGWVVCKQPDYWEWRVQLSINIFTCKRDSSTNICRIGQLDWSVARNYHFVQFWKDFLRPDT